MIATFFVKKVFSALFDSSVWIVIEHCSTTSSGNRLKRCGMNGRHDYFIVNAQKLLSLIIFIVTKGEWLGNCKRNGGMCNPSLLYTAVVTKMYLKYF